MSAVVIGFSIVKIDYDAWKSETEKTGKTKFEVEAIASITGTYLINIESYEPALKYQYKPIN